MLCKKGVLRNFAKFIGIHLCQSAFFNRVAGLRPQACNSIKKDTLAQVFSCEFCEISKDTFSYRTLPVAASACIKKKLQIWKYILIRLPKKQNGKEKMNLFNKLKYSIKNTHIVRCRKLVMLHFNTFKISSYL